MDLNQWRYRFPKKTFEIIFFKFNYISICHECVFSYIDPSVVLRQHKNWQSVTLPVVIHGAVVRGSLRIPPPPQIITKKSKKWSVLSQSFHFTPLKTNDDVQCVPQYWTTPTEIRGYGPSWSPMNIIRIFFGGFSAGCIIGGGFAYPIFHGG